MTDMTPHEHYREAEQLAATARALVIQADRVTLVSGARYPELSHELERFLRLTVSAAQVHATLATVNQDHHEYWRSEEAKQAEVEPL